MNFNLIKICYI